MKPNIFWKYYNEKLQIITEIIRYLLNGNYYH